MARILACYVLAVSAALAVCAAVPEETRAASPAALVGRVVDDRGAPLAEAEVKLRGGTGTSATTGADGVFELRVPGLPITLVVSREGFAATVVEVAEAGGELRVALVPADEAVTETLLVEGRFLGDRHSPNSISSSVVDLVGEIAPPPTVREALVKVAGVSENGQGGIFQNFSIRGTSRWRVLSLVEGMRVVTERRAGVSASFLDPQLLDSIDVLRGPATTYYGSGALGGVVQLLPRRFEHWNAGAGYEEQGSEVFQSVGWGDRSWSAGLVRRDADDAETAEGETLFSRYEQTSGTLRRRFGSGERLSGSVLLVGSLGDDIGKANVDYPERTTIYPDERHGFARFALDSSGGWRASLWAHPNELVTDVFELADGTRQRVENTAFDLGGLFEHVLPLSESARESFDGRLGVEWVGRRVVDAIETSYDALGSPFEEARTLDGAREDEAAAFAVANWSRGRVRVEAGVRVTSLRQENPGASDLVFPGGEALGEARSESAPAGFAGVAVEFGRLHLLANAGTGVRFANLSERFFVGTTGRGGVIGNPLLDEETARNGDVGLRWFGDRVHALFTVYRNEFDDYIERVEIEPGLRTYVNLDSGTIEGFETDGFVRLSDAGAALQARLEWAAHAIEGRSDQDAPLADVPADRIRVGTVLSSNPWRGSVGLEWRADKDDPGSGEHEIPEAWLLTASLERQFAGAWSVVLAGENLLDEAYFASADEDVQHAPGRSVGVMVRWEGGGG